MHWNKIRNAHMIPHHMAVDVEKFFVHDMSDPPPLPGPLPVYENKVCVMKTATHGTDEGRSRVKGIDCSAPDCHCARDGNRKAFSLSILHFLCPLTLSLCPHTQSLSIVRRYITLHAGTSCELSVHVASIKYQLRYLTLTDQLWDRI